MQWWEVSFDIPGEATEAVSALIQEWPEVQGIAMDGPLEAEPNHPEYGEWFDQALLEKKFVRVSFYLPDDALQANIEQRLATVLDVVRGAGLDVGPAKDTILLGLVDESSWEAAWKQEYQPIEIGQRLIVVPKWLADEHEWQSDRIRILLEPGMAFGTGTHQTTQLCLQALERMDLRAKRVLDIGCGTAVLAIAAAKFGARNVTAIDIDPVAVRVAYENLVENDVVDDVQVAQGDLLTGVREAGYDVAVANILRDVVIALAPQAADVVKPGGVLIVSGFITSQAPAVQRALEQAGFQVMEQTTMDDWVATMAVRVS
jgi:ribosomal protein L11 methyltransferase